MSRPQLIMGCYGIFIVGMLLSVISSTRWLIDTDVNVINQLAGFSTVDVSTMGGWGIAKSVYTWFAALVTMISWNFPYLDNVVGFILKAVILYPVTIGVVISLIEGAQTVIQGIASTIRSLLPS